MNKIKYMAVAIMLLMSMSGFAVTRLGNDTGNAGNVCLLHFKALSQHISKHIYDSRALSVAKVDVETLESLLNADFKVLENPMINGVRVDSINETDPNVIYFRHSKCELLEKENSRAISFILHELLEMMGLDKDYSISSQILNELDGALLISPNEMKVRKAFIKELEDKNSEIHKYFVKIDKRNENGRGTFPTLGQISPADIEVMALAHETSVDYYHDCSYRNSKRDQRCDDDEWADKHSEVVVNEYNFYRYLVAVKQGIGIRRGMMEEVYFAAVIEVNDDIHENVPVFELKVINIVDLEGFGSPSEVNINSH